METTGGVSLNLTGPNYIDLDPSVTYVYVPARKLNYDDVIKPLDDQLNIEGVRATKQSSDVFYWKKPCSEMKAIA